MTKRTSSAYLFLVICALGTAVLSTLAPSKAQAAENGSTAIVDQLPAQIPEILTGGKWSNGEVGGVYRAVVVMSDSGKPQGLAAKAAETETPAVEPLTTAALASATEAPLRKAEVYIQWIANSGTVPSIVKTVSVKEFNEKQLRHAFLAMDTLKDNEVTLLVTSYDEQSLKDVSVSIKATSPGKYEPAK